MLDDFDATDIPDDVRDVVKFLVDGPLWQFCRFCVLLFLMKPDEVLNEVLDWLVEIELILEFVALITFIEHIGTGKTASDVNFILSSWTVLYKLQLSFSGDITQTDGIILLFKSKFGDVSHIFWASERKVWIGWLWFKHSPESLWQLLNRFSLLWNATK